MMLILGLRLARADRLRWIIGLDMWIMLVIDRGDESTRIAVDLLVAMFPRKDDMAAFDYRDYVWVLWIKVAIQYVMAMVVLLYVEIPEAQAVEVELE